MMVPIKNKRFDAGTKAMNNAKKPAVVFLRDVYVHRFCAGVESFVFDRHHHGRAVSLSAVGGIRCVRGNCALCAICDRTRIRWLRRQIKKPFGHDGADQKQRSDAGTKSDERNVLKKTTAGFSVSGYLGIYHRQPVLENWLRLLRDACVHRFCAGVESYGSAPS